MVKTWQKDGTSTSSLTKQPSHLSTAPPGSQDECRAVGTWQYLFIVCPLLGLTEPFDQSCSRESMSIRFPSSLGLPPPGSILTWKVSPTSPGASWEQGLCDPSAPPAWAPDSSAWHLLETYCVPGTVLNPLNVGFYAILTAPMRWIYCLPVLQMKRLRFIGVLWYNWDMNPGCPPPDSETNHWPSLTF